MSKFLRKVKNLGPGALVAAAFIGPGTITSCSVSGAAYGYVLLWAILLSVISVIVMQSMAARIGIVSKMGLGQALRKKFTKRATRIFLIILVISAVFIGNVAYETGNITGSIVGMRAAFTPVMDDDFWKWILASIIFVVAGILLFSGSHKHIEKFLTALVVVMGFIFLACAIASQPNWIEVLKGLCIPRIPEIDGGSSWMTIAALMGTTVVPYNIYLHASSAAKKWSNDKTDTNEALSNSRFDTALSIGFGGVISGSIIVCAATVIYGTDITVTNGEDMANALQPLLGDWASMFFGVGLFAAGISSTITAPLAAAYASSGILGMGEDLKSWKFRTFWIIVLVLGFVMSVTIGASPTRIILFAQAANAFLIPITGVLLIIVTCDKKIMGKYKNKLWFTIIACLVLGIFIFIAVRNFTAFMTSLQAMIVG